MDDFYAARSGAIPPLPGTTFPPPITLIERMKELGAEMMKTWREDASPEVIAVLERYIAMQ